MTKSMTADIRCARYDIYFLIMFFDTYLNINVLFKCFIYITTSNKRCLRKERREANYHANVF